MNMHQPVDSSFRSSVSRSWASAGSDGGRRRVLVVAAILVAAAVAAWLVLSGRAPDAAEAIARIRARRPRIVLHPPHLHALEALAAHAPCATIPLAAPCQT